MKKRQMKLLGDARCGPVRGGIEVSLAELLPKNISGYDEKRESENPVIETLQKQILRDIDQNLVIL